MSINILRVQLIALLLLIFIPDQSVHADTGPVVLSIGGTAWYSDWRPPWRDSKRVLTVPFFAPTANMFGSSSPYPYTIGWKINSFKMAPGAMGGPSLSLNLFNRVTISSAFTIGKYSAMSQGTTIIFLTSKYTRDILKYDSDSTMSISLHRFVRIFVGFKYQGYDYDEKMRYTVGFGGGGGYIASGKAAFRNYGPALGFNVSAPLYQGLYLIISSSASYMISTAAYKFKYSIIIPDLTPILSQYKKDRMKAVANNNTLTFAYTIGRSGVTLALGFRHQMIYYWQKNTKASFIDYNRKFEHFLGGSFSVIYSINLVKQESDT